MLIKRLQPERLLSTITVSNPEVYWDDVDPEFTQAWLECSTIVNSLTYTTGQIEVSQMDETTIDVLGIRQTVEETSVRLVAAYEDKSEIEFDINPALEINDLVDVILQENLYPSGEATILGEPIFDVNGTPIQFSTINQFESIRVRVEFESYVLVGVDLDDVDDSTPDRSVPYVALIDKILDERGRIIFIQ